MAEVSAQCDLAIVGAGAAGLAAAIFAGEGASGKNLKIVLLEGAKRVGAKILVSGGGRCNVTNETVTENDYWGGPAPIIRSVLKAFDHRRTIDWMRSLGVELKLEPTGKYFPVSDSARTVLDALLRRVGELGIELRTGARVNAIRREGDGFALGFVEGEPLYARRLIMAVGGRSLPKSGSDGVGLGMARRLGHTLLPTFPALVPLVLGEGAADAAARRFAELSGVTVEVRLELRERNGRKIFEWTDSLLFTHFGISGPAAMNLSRHYLIARENQRGIPPVLSFGNPKFATVEAADRWLLAKAAENAKLSVTAAVGEVWPARLAQMLTEGLRTLGQMTKEQRRGLAGRLVAVPLEVKGDRGWSFAETTAGGIDLREIDSKTMASRKLKHLFLCGEMLDVDGRIGGFNFQWAWASGYLAGRGASSSLAGSPEA